jgi:hypothetical protein
MQIHFKYWAFNFRGINPFFHPVLNNVVPVGTIREIPVFKGSSGRPDFPFDLIPTISM